MTIANFQEKVSQSKTFDRDLVGAYLREIGRIPLLTHEEELFYGKQVQKMMKILQQKEVFKQKLYREPTLGELATELQQNETEITKILQQGQRAKNKMIVANLRLVITIAKKYQKRDLEFPDLIQEGTLGLERGVEKFDPSFGYKFSTYAYWWIRQGITRAISQKARLIRLPTHVTEMLNKIKKVRRELSQQLGRNPTHAEISLVLNLEPSEICKYLTLARPSISLEQKVGDNEDTELKELLSDEKTSADNYLIQECLRQDIEKLLAELKPLQQKILILRFGLKDGCPLSLTEIGKRLKMNRESVRQIEQQALFSLRRCRHKIKEYRCDI
jgi:RNA polymerase nonessential primary-like sigma factor